MKLPLLSHKKTRNNNTGFPLPELPDLINLQFQLDGADLNTIMDGSGAVSQWDDKSGKGHNVIQVTGSKQPMSGISAINGLNVIQFDGVNDVLTDITFTDFTTLTFFAVGEFEAGDTSQAMFDVTAGNNTNTGFGLFHTQGDLKFRAFELPNSPDLIVPSLPLPVKHMFSVTVGPPDSKFYLDGAFVDSSPSTGLENPLTRIDVGQLVNLNSHSLKGPIGELIIYNRALSDLERAEVEVYLSDKWGIVLYSAFSEDFSLDFA